MSSEILQKEYEFSLVLGDLKEITTDLEDKLFEAGCDDATLSKQRGDILITFTRRARSYEEAVNSAIENVKNAQTGASDIYALPK